MADPASALRTYLDDLASAAVRALDGRTGPMVSVRAGPAAPPGPCVGLQPAGLRPTAAGMAVRLAVDVVAPDDLQYLALRTAVGVAFGREPRIAHGDTELVVTVVDEGEALFLDVGPA